MILIQSQDFDISTNEVIEWLISFGAPFKRLNVEEHTARLVAMDIAADGRLNFTLAIGHDRIHTQQLTAYWHRRGKMNLDPIERHGYSNLKGTFGQKAVNEIKINLQRERETLNLMIDKELTELPRSIGDAGKGTLNKLSVLQKAAEVGLKISPTVITSEKQVMNSFLDDQKEIITKAILDNLFTQTVNENLVFYTELISRERMTELPDNFFYSLFQKKIEKAYELRIFYLLEKFYAMAIFSQSDDQTSVDFRKYNDSKPNRRVPFELPEEIKTKLSTLMKMIKLNSGSIDMIVTKDLEYIFLEVNPVGQFAMVSHPCNYPAEKEIAQYLSTGQMPD